MKLRELMKQYIRIVGLAVSVITLAPSLFAQLPSLAVDSLLTQVMPPSFDQPIDPDRYLIRPGEVIHVTFLQTSMSPLALEVSADGLVISPALGAIDVKGLTLSQARAQLTEVLRSKYNVKEMMMTIDEPRPIGITVSGAVERPGFYRIYSSERASDAIRLAGGILPEGSRRRITFSGGPQAIAVDLDRALYLGDDRANPCLYAGYHINVPVRSAAVVQVLGEVVNPRVVEMRSDDELVSILRLAGGLTADADSAGVTLLGRQVSNIWQPGQLLANDIIWVPSRVKTTELGVAVLGEVNKPGRFTCPDGLTLRAALEQAGGYTAEANSSRVTIFRIAETDEYSHAQRERFPMIAVNEDFQNTLLKPMDSIFVPRKLGWVRVSGPVKSPGIFPYVEGKDAVYYIFTAGGFLPTADPEKVGLTNRVSHIRRLVSVSTRVLDGDEISAQLRMVNP